MASMCLAILVKAKKEKRPKDDGTNGLSLPQDGGAPIELPNIPLQFNDVVYTVKIKKIFKVCRHINICITSSFDS